MRCTSWTKYQYPPPFPSGYATGTWTVFNTIVTSGGGVILFDPDDEALDEATIPWSISHMDYHPTFDVTVSVMTVTGSLVKTLTATAGLGAGSLIWNGSTNAGPTATKGVYTYQVSAAHRWNAYPDQLCSDAAFADLGVQGGLPGFELHADLDQVRLKTGYTLSRAVAACGLDVFDPALSVCHSASSLATVAGTYESDWTWKPAVSGPPHTYTNVIYTSQTAAEGLQNRDLQPKPGLRRGGGQTYGVAANGFRDPLTMGSWGDVAQDMAQVGYSPVLSDEACATRDQAQGVLEETAIWTSVGHGQPGLDQVAWVCLVGWGHYIMDYDNPVADENPALSTPPGYSPLTCLNVRDYAGQWQQLRFVMLQCCGGGRTYEHSDLVQSFVDAGADCALGFTYDNLTMEPVSHYWQFVFWESACDQGRSVSQAANDARDAVEAVAATYGWGLHETGYDTARICGDGGTVLTPARYGW